ncbi:unnamed protein product, partial [Tetraodon nigroviridis]
QTHTYVNTVDMEGDLSMRHCVHSLPEVRPSTFPETPHGAMPVGGPGNPQSNLRCCPMEEHNDPQVFLTPASQEVKFMLGPTPAQPPAGKGAGAARAQSPQPSASRGRHRLRDRPRGAFAAPVQFPLLSPFPSPLAAASGPGALRQLPERGTHLREHQRPAESRKATAEPQQRVAVANVRRHRPEEDRRHVQPAESSAQRRWDFQKDSPQQHRPASVNGCLD